MIFLTLVSFGLWVYTRVVLTSAVAEAARYAANSDVPTAEAIDRARQILGGGPLGSTRNTLTCSQSQDAGTGLIFLDCTMKTPGLFPILNGVFPDLHVTGHSLKEVVRS